jgi:hypothetical protein
MIRLTGCRGQAAARRRRVKCQQTLGAGEGWHPVKTIKNSLQRFDA